MRIKEIFGLGRDRDKEDGGHDWGGHGHWGGWGGGHNWGGWGHRWGGWGGWGGGSRWGC